MQLMMVKAKLETRTRTRKMEKLEKDWSISTIADLQEDMTRSAIYIYIYIYSYHDQPILAARSDEPTRGKCETLLTSTCHKPLTGIQNLTSVFEYQVSPKLFHSVSVIKESMISGAKY